MSTSIGISLIAVGVVVRFAIPAGSSHSLSVSAVGTGLMLLGALSLVLSLLVWGPLNPAARRHHSGTSVLARSEKRLYQDQNRQLLPRGSSPTGASSRYETRS